MFGKLRVITANWACNAYKTNSKWYWLLHELHLIFYWWGRENTRWQLHLESKKEKSKRK